MENNKERVMAYNLARKIDKQELEDVSGGTVRVSNKPSAQATADGKRCMDLPDDAVFDW